MWSQILVVVCTVFAIIYFILKIPSRLKPGFLLALFVLISLLFFYLNFIEYPLFVQEIVPHVQILTICSLLSLELIIIRSLKPIHSRFPSGFIFVPFLAYLSFPLMLPSESLHLIYVLILGGATVIVSFLLIAGLFNEIDSPGFLLTGNLLLSVAFFFYVLNAVYSGIDDWIIDLPLAFGMVLTVSPVCEIFNKIISG